MSIVLRLSNCSQNSLKHHLQNLEIKLDGFAIDPAETVAENPTPTRDLIFSGFVNPQEEPLVVVNEFEGEAGSGNHVYAIWNIETFISTSSILFVAYTDCLLTLLLLFLRTPTDTNSTALPFVHRLCQPEPI